MGLSNDLHRTGYHIQEMRIVNKRGKCIAGFGTRALLELTGGRYVTISRSALSRLLVERIKDSTEIILGDEICSLHEREDGVGVQFKHGGERSFDLVAGADGLHSGVRRLVFGPQNRFEKQLGYMVAAFETIGYRARDEDIYVMYSDPGRMVGRVTLRENRTLFLFVFAVDIAAPATLPDVSGQKAMLRERFADRARELPQILDALDDAKGSSGKD